MTESEITKLFDLYAYVCSEWYTVQAELKRLRAYDGNDDHPENRCQRCGGRNLHNWYTDNEVWNSVVGDSYSILCPFCLQDLAAEKGVAPTAWKISRDGDTLRKCFAAVAGR